MAWVYILNTKANKYYIGSTNDLQKRLRQHREGKTASTKKLGAKSFAFVQEYPTLETARWVETKLKKLKRRDYIEKILKDGYIRLKPE